MIERARDYARSVFRRLDEAGLHALVQAAHIKSYPNGTFLCHEGAMEETFYILVSGNARVFQQLGPDEKTLVAVRGPGAYFGETGLVLGRGRNADVITDGECVLLELDRNSFTRIVRDHPDVAWELSRITVERESETQLTIEEKRRLEKLRQLEAEGKRADHRIVFTSYSRRDEDFVKRLIHDIQPDLDEVGITIWLDQLHIRPGHDWDTEIEKTLESAAAMLLVLSQESVQSKNVKDEWSYFVDERKTLIPVLKEECKIPFRLRTLQFIDFTKLDYATALARLHAALVKIADNSGH